MDFLCLLPHWLSCSRAPEIVPRAGALHQSCCCCCLADKVLTNLSMPPPQYLSCRRYPCAAMTTWGESAPPAQQKRLTYPVSLSLCLMEAPVAMQASTGLIWVWTRKIHLELVSLQDNSRLIHDRVTTSTFDSMAQAPLQSWVCNSKVGSLSWYYGRDPS